MQYRKLGRSGLKVSAVGLGSWLTFGTRVAKDDVKKLTRAALDAGVNFVDTADIYDHGAAEENLGAALAGVPRHSYVLATKVFWPMTPSDPNDRGLSRKHIHESIARSLSRLKTDYVDLYQCHRYDVDTPVEEVVLAMSDLVTRGLVLYWGVSCWTAAQVTEAVRLADQLGARRPISNQPPYSMLDRDVELDFETDWALGVGQVVWSPLAQGILTGKYAKGKVPQGSRAADDARNTFLKPMMTPENLARADAVSGIAKKHGLTSAQLALAWTVRREEVASAIIGVTSKPQLEENLKAGSVALDPSVWDEVEKALGNQPEARSFV
ncbi:aldo/keto reductase family protein [bacterium]|nr:aldo/keto reductase family protein [bacterium]